MACEHPGPNAKAGGAGAAGKTGGGGGGAGRTGGAAAAAGWARGAACADPYSLAVGVPVVHDERVELV